jgi:molybdate transport system ATP-binding protein
VRGGALIALAPQAAIGEHRRVRVIAGDVSLAREPPGLSSILNILPARIVSAKQVDADEIIAVLALGADGLGARLLSRLTRKSWDALGLAEGTSVHAQVKAVALAPGRGELG